MSYLVAHNIMYLGSLQFLFILLRTRASWARVLHKVPEPTKLGYIIVGHQVRHSTWWGIKLLIFFFFIYDSGLALFNFFLLIFFLIFFYLYNMLLFEANVCLFFFIYDSGAALLKTFFINSIFFNFYFFYLYNM